MYKYFLKPIWIIGTVYLIGGLSLASDVAQLTDFNILDYLKEHSPQSFCFLFIGTLLLYFGLVMLEYFRNKHTKQSHIVKNDAGQFVNTTNVSNSSIIQIRKDNNGKN